MEILLRTEILYRNRACEIFREKVKQSTGCIISECKKEGFDQCVEICMKPCVDAKLEYEQKRNLMLDQIKNEFIEKCTPEDKQCKQLIVEDYLPKIDSLISQ